MPGHFVISLDFELMWGVRDHRSVADYGDAVLGGRAAIPRMLDLFARHGVRATWATVGMLMARSRDEIMDHAPALRPAYRSAGESPYAFVAGGLGRGENDDPWHFGRSLVDRIAETPGQEIGTHSFSHFHYLEPGFGPEAFAADLDAARGIAAAAGLAPRSVVFARNQLDETAINIAVARGFPAFRGNPDSPLYRARAGAGNSAAIRLGRLLDSVAPLSQAPVRGWARALHGGVDVPASRFLRPWNAGAPLLSRLHLRRILREMDHAARAGSVYHLWWHPHNMGRQTEANLARLEAILRHFRALADSHGMQSRAMADFLPDGSA